MPFRFLMMNSFDSHWNGGHRYYTLLKMKVTGSAYDHTLHSGLKLAEHQIPNALLSIRIWHAVMAGQVDVVHFEGV